MKPGAHGVDVFAARWHRPVGFIVWRFQSAVSWLSVVILDNLDLFLNGCKLGLIGILFICILYVCVNLLNPPWCSLCLVMIYVNLLWLVGKWIIPWWFGRLSWVIYVAYFSIIPPLKWSQIIGDIRILLYFWLNECQKLVMWLIIWVNLLPWLNWIW